MAILAVWASNASAEGQEPAPHVDAPLWPLMLTSPLETVVLSVHVVGDKSADLIASEIEAACFTYLQQALQRVSNVSTITYGDYFAKRLPYRSDATAVIHYKVTLKAWDSGNSKSSVILGVVQWELALPGGSARSDAAVYAPLELFEAAPDSGSVRGAIVEAIESHMDAYVVKAVIASH
jgi:hypothetical protein